MCRIIFFYDNYGAYKFKDSPILVLMQCPKMTNDSKASNDTPNIALYTSILWISCQVVLFIKILNSQNKNVNKKSVKNFCSH